MLIIYDIKGVDKNEDIFFKYVLNIVKRERQKEKKQEILVATTWILNLRAALSAEKISKRGAPELPLHRHTDPIQ